MSINTFSVLGVEDMDIEMLDLRREAGPIMLEDRSTQRKEAQGTNIVHQSLGTYKFKFENSSCILNKNLGGVSR